MAQVDVDAGRVDAVLDPQRAALPGRAIQFPAEFLLGDDLLDPTPEELKNPRNNYFFVATALLEAKSDLTAAILHADPDGLSTDTSDLLADLLPLV